MPLIRDDDGNIIPLGRTIRTFDDPLIPGLAFANTPAGTPWLTTDLGTANFNSGVSAATNPGQATIATAATINSFARVKTNFVILDTNYKEIVWTVQALSCDVDSPIKMQFGISQDGNNGGCDLVQASTDALASIQTTAAAATNGTYPANYRLVDGNAFTAVAVARKYKNITMRLQPQLGKVYILEDDQDMVAADISATFTHGSLRPYVVMQTLEAVAHNFKISRATLTLIH